MIMKCNRDSFESEDVIEFADHMADEHGDVSFYPCSECENGYHNNCPCPCVCPCEVKK